MPSVPGLAICATPPLTCVPGAQRSGFFRLSSQGPRLEKLMRSLALLALGGAVMLLRKRRQG